MNRKRLFSILRTLLFLVIGVALLWLVLRNQNISEVWNKIKEAKWQWLLVSMALGFVSNIFRALRWNMLITPLGKTPKLYNTFGAVMIGYLANLAIPRLGEITRCGALSRYEKMRFDQLLGTVLVERIIDVLTLLSCLVLILILQFSRMKDFVMQQIVSPVTSKVAALFSGSWWAYMIVIGIIAVIGIAVFFGLSRMRKTGVTAKIRQAIVGFGEGLKTIGELENKKLFFLYTIALWFLYWMMSYVCFFCFSETADLGIIAGLVVMVMGGFGFAAPVQGGIGTYHILVSQTLMLYGISQQNGLAMAIITHGVQIFGMLVLGLLAWWLLPLINKNRLAEV